MAKEIDAHVRKNPGAGDTAEGVMRWWICSSRGRATLEVVEEALEQLAASGTLGVRTLASGERLYFAARPPADLEVE